MTESTFHKTPEELDVLRDQMTCVNCSRKMTDCGCWIKCNCGWLKYRTDKNCNNKECTKK